MTNYYKLQNSDLLFPYILQSLEKWFNDNTKIWVSSEEGKKVLIITRELWGIVAHVNIISIDYKNALTLLELLKFNSAEIISTVANKLESLLLNSSGNCVKRITTQSPKLTAIKIISGIKNYTNEFVV